MPTHESKHHKQRVLDICERLQRELDLGWITVLVKFHENNDERITCQTVADWEYRQATLDWNLPIVASIRDEELERTALHEFVHVLLGPIHTEVKETYERVEEFTTECITRALEHYRATAR